MDYQLHCYILIRIYTKQNVINKKLIKHKIIIISRLV